MTQFRKRLLLVSVASLFTCGAAPGAWAQPFEPLAPGPAIATRDEAPPADRLETLYDQLAEPGREDWQRVEKEIQRIWSQSGSASMDLLLERGNAALQARDYDTALDYFSALTDHAPDFAEGWNARATTFFLLEEYGLSISDVEHVLVLNPRHFGALQGLAIMLEEVGEPDLALRALRRAHALNPDQPEVAAAIERLERMKGAAEL